MANVVRQDIAQIAFDVDFDALKKISKEVDEFKKRFTGGIGDDAFSELKKNAEKSVPPLGEVTKETGNIKQRITEIGGKASDAAYRGLKRIAGVSFKGLAVGIGAAATAVGALVTNAVKTYADFEQFEGGVDTLFKGSAQTVKNYANDAFKTAGLSANDYMNTVTSFSASLISSVGGDTAKAAELANTAVIDMSDNANKMGTDMGSIIMTYQSLARGNYEMLDNLKLGYGGTKTELQRLIQDAAKLDKSIDASSMSFANIVKSIHAVQESMDIMGTTQKEAEGTITGSLSMVKSAWGNLMPALIQGGESFDRCVENLIYSVDKFADNLMPALQKALSGAGRLIERLAPKLEEVFPELTAKLLPPLLKAATSLAAGLIQSLPTIIKTIAKEMPNLTKELVLAIYEAFTGKEMSAKAFSSIEGAVKGLGNAVKWLIPIVIGLAGAIKGAKALQSLSSVFSFGGKSKGGQGSGGKSGGIFKTFQELAKLKLKTVLKGIANLSVIVIGLGALLLLVSKLFPGGVDFANMLGVIALVGALGAVGLGLSKFAGIIGKIPIVTVLKGLANMAVVLAGVGALLWLATKVFGGGVNFAEMLGVIALIGILGAVGSVLSVFAGVVGLIPIPVVLAGLANIALVLGGISAIIVAFGALSQIPGFMDFLNAGGKVLTKIFNVLGEMVGSLIGGIGEGISNSLPKIGENLSAFAEALRPMFSVFSGADMGGVGSFFGAIGEFMLKMAGNNILSFFTGGTDLPEFGTQLTAFARNAGGFFQAAAGFPAAGFENAKLLFQSISDMGNVPKTGGIAQWFTGTTDFAALTSGLAQLSGADVAGFYTTAAGLPAAGFDNAKLLFQSLSDIGNIPNTGGVAQWFSGTNDFAALAGGLAQLSGAGVVGFYRTVAAFPQEAFENAKLLFQSLSDIGNIPNTGGVGQWFSGTNDFGALAEGLKQLGSGVREFFEQVSTAPQAAIDAFVQMYPEISSAAGRVDDLLETKRDSVVDLFEKTKKKLVSIVQSAMSALKSEIGRVSLYQSGAELLNGLIKGIESRMGALKKAVEKAAEVGNTAFNNAERIDSPSKVWAEKGRFLIAGLEAGLMDSLPSLEKSAGLAGEAAVPYRTAYAPESSAVTYSRERNAEYNTYAPQFNLTVSGTSDDRTTARRVKRWVKEAMRDTFASMDRRSPQLIEI